MKALLFVVVMIYGCNGMLPSSPNGTTTAEQNANPINGTEQTIAALEALRKFSEIVKNASSSKEPSKFDRLFEEGFVFEKCSSSGNSTWLGIFNTTKVVLKVKGLWNSEKTVRIDLEVTRKKYKVRDITFDINSTTGKLISGHVQGCQKRRWGSFISTPFFPISIFGPFNPLNLYKEMSMKGLQAFMWTLSVLIKH